jgi:hypothetical protein
MTTATIATPIFSYFSNLTRSVDNLIGAVLLIQPSIFVESLSKAIAMMRCMSGQESRQISPARLEELRAIMGLEPLAK